MIVIARLVPILELIKFLVIRNNGIMNEVILAVVVVVDVVVVVVVSI